LQQHTERRAGLFCVGEGTGNEEGIPSGSKRGKKWTGGYRFSKYLLKRKKKGK